MASEAEIETSKMRMASRVATGTRDIRRDQYGLGVMVKTVFKFKKLDFFI